MRDNKSKSRQSARTFHRERLRIQLNRYAEGVLSDDDDELLIARINVMDNIGEELNKGLHKIVPDPHELFQCLHHAATYDSCCTLLCIGNDVSLMAAYLLMFPPALVDVYKNIVDMFYDEDLQWLYKPGPNVPEPPRAWIGAFQNKKLDYLKMDEKSFKYIGCFLLKRRRMLASQVRVPEHQ